MTRGVAVGNGPVVAVGDGGATGRIAVGTGVGATVGGGGSVGMGLAVGIAAILGGAAVGTDVAVGGGMGVEVATGIGTSVGNGVAVGMGARAGEITSDVAGSSSTCTGPGDARRAAAMASTSAWGSLPLSGATPVTA
jgi:hypothetical protein